MRPLLLREVKLGQDVWLWHVLPSVMLVMMVALDAICVSAAHFSTLGLVTLLVLLSGRRLKRGIIELFGDVRYCVKCGHAFILEPQPPNFHLKESFAPLGRGLRELFLKLYYRDSKRKRPPR
jgi:hypothetical protein